MTSRTAQDPGRDVVLAVDGGGSKTDIVAVTLDGSLIGHARGPGSNPQVLGLDTALGILDRLRTAVLLEAGDVRVVETHVYLSGLDDGAGCRGRRLRDGYQRDRGAARRCDRTVPRARRYLG